MMSPALIKTINIRCLLAITLLTITSVAFCRKNISISIFVESKPHQIAYETIL